MPQLRCMGSFRLAIIIPHLHGKFNFTESVLETVGKSLRHSCGMELTHQGVSLPQDRQNTAAVYLILVGSYSQPSICWGTGQTSDLIRNLKIQQSLVFLLNSRFPVLYVTVVISRYLTAHLIPKLQCNFAEFLKYCYFKRLGIFYQITCVGLQYGLYKIRIFQLPTN